MENYTLIKKLGRGRYGEVWLAERKQDPAYVAIKMIPVEDEDQPNTNREVQLLA